LSVTSALLRAHVTGDTRNVPIAACWRRYCFEAYRRAADTHDRRVALPTRCQLCGAPLAQVSVVNGLFLA
jgi:hypothetical protein